MFARQLHTSPVPQCCPLAPRQIRQLAPGVKEAATRKLNMSDLVFLAASLASLTLVGAACMLYKCS